MDSNKKIPKVFIVYFIVLFLIMCIPFIIMWKNYRNDYNTNKEEAINFFKENRENINEIIDNLLENKTKECSKLEYYEFCYQNDNSIKIEESNGIFTANWKLLYSNNKWYYCYKDCDKREVLEDL